MEFFCGVAQTNPQEMLIAAVIAKGLKNPIFLLGEAATGALPSPGRLGFRGSLSSATGAEGAGTNEHPIATSGQRHQRRDGLVHYRSQKERVLASISRAGDCFTNQKGTETIISFSLYPTRNVRADCCPPRSECRR